VADQQHLEILHQGVPTWNQWRDENPGTNPDLRDANLERLDLTGAHLHATRLNRAKLAGVNLYRAGLGFSCLDGADLQGAHLAEANINFSTFRETNLHAANLRKVNFSGANFEGADLSNAFLEGTDLSTPEFNHVNLNDARLRNANLRGQYLAVSQLRNADLCDAFLDDANLSGADLTGAYLGGASLRSAKLVNTNLTGADLGEADLFRANLTGANLHGANLNIARLVESNLDGADLTESRVYGVSAWDISLINTNQRDLCITPPGLSRITVDNLEVAQFMYLLLNNKKIRDVIDTITSKVVLILGRFTPARKATLDALRDALRKRNYLPVLFDFEKPMNRDLTETVSTLAHLARFVIADLTDPRSIPQELTAIISLQSVPIRPLLLGSQQEWAMFHDLARRIQVIEPLHYTSDEMLLTLVDSAIIDPAEKKAKELAGK
jgi:uncharacterized protein YjbI with pentapeptide repeats